jgi:c-di-GMP-binding flagellar brake protein YcgR
MGGRIMEYNPLIAEILISGRTVQLEFTNNNGHKIKTKSTVIQLEETELILALPKKEDAFNQLATNAKVVVVCKYNDQPHDYVFFTQFAKIKGSDPPIVLLNRPLEVSLGRHAFRYDVQISFSYFYHDKEYKDGMVENLSSIGLLAAVMPNENLKVSIEIPIKIFLPTTTQPLLIIGKIVRISNGDTRYLVGMNFPNIAMDAQDQITKFLFSLQKTTLRKEQQQKVAFIKIN